MEGRGGVFLGRTTKNISEEEEERANLNRKNSMSLFFLPASDSWDTVSLKLDLIDKKKNLSRHVGSLFVNLYSVFVMRANRKAKSPGPLV